MNKVFVLVAEIRDDDCDIILEKHIPEVFTYLDDALKYMNTTYPGMTKTDKYVVEYHAEHINDEGIKTTVFIYERDVN